MWIWRSGLERTEPITSYDNSRVVETEGWVAVQLRGGVILSAAAFQAKRRACPELAEGISRLTSFARKPNCTSPRNRPRAQSQGKRVELVRPYYSLGTTQMSARLR